MLQMTLSPCHDMIFVLVSRVVTSCRLLIERSKKTLRLDTASCNPKRESITMWGVPELAVCVVLVKLELQKLLKKSNKQQVYSFISL